MNIKVTAFTESEKLYYTIDVSFIAYCVTEFEALFLAMFERQFLKYPPNIS